KFTRYVKRNTQSPLHYAFAKLRVEIGVEAPYTPVARSGVSQSLKLALVDELQVDTLAGTRWIVWWDRDTALRGVTDGRALLYLLDMGADLRTAANVHAKVYITPATGTVVFGSANLTGGGLREYHEIVRASDDPDEAAVAKEHFDAWWQQAEPLDRRQVEHLKPHLSADAAQSLYERWLRLAEVGAFVSIQYRTNFDWTAPINWRTFGLKRPKLSTGKLAPARLHLAPKRLEDLPAQARRRCEEWARTQGIEHDRRQFLTVDRFGDLHEFVAREEQRLRSELAASDQEWRHHKERVRQEVHEWLASAGKPEAEALEGTLVGDRVDRLVRMIPPRWPPRAWISLEYRLDLPHPHQLDRLWDRLHPTERGLRALWQKADGKRKQLHFPSG
ncbi:MAG: hypothetical protein FJX75_16135, partial [Armatimonadetes bacterium]|nr:hypothetical protein [Armatimonadota bacterium]